MKNVGIPSGPALQMGTHLPRSPIFHAWKIREHLGEHPLKPLHVFNLTCKEGE